jgi:NAD(P)-dependent dehydrogenase (short-subunit alcohol dehydrogenase family)
MEIKNQTALVTGAGSGLGAATARLLAGLGAKVAVLDYNLSAAKAIADEIGGISVGADVSKANEVEKAFDDAIAALGDVPRIVVNCAGIGLAARMVGREGKLSLDVFDKTIKVNLYGTYHVMSYAARAMNELKPINETGETGVIINTASVAWQDGQLGQAAYAASKGAIASLCLPAAREFARSGIRVMAIAPGLFETAMTEALPDDVRTEITGHIPFPSRLGMPEEYAQLVRDIVMNSYLNATTIRLDGAVRLPPR